MQNMSIARTFTTVTYLTIYVHQAQHSLWVLYDSQWFVVMCLSLSTRRERAASKGTYLLSQVPQSTEILCLGDPLSQPSLTLFFIKTGNRGGTGGTNSHQQTVENEGRTGGHPTLNNAHQGSGVCCGERVNKSGAVGCFSWVAMAKKQSWPQKCTSKTVTLRAAFTYYVNQVWL